MASMQTLAWAHHDGSALYAPDGPVALGDEVALRVRTAEEAQVERVWLRTVLDGEPAFVAAEPTGERDGERWFTVRLTLHNPLTPYRFLLQAHGDIAWLNGTGLHRRDVTDHHDFRLHTEDSSPAWLRDAVVYQVFPDRFAPDPSGAAPGDLPGWALPKAWDEEPATDGPAAVTEVYGGTLAGIEARLDHLVALGVTTLYLTPFFPGRSNHRYDASTFDHVDPLLGGDEALASLARAAHARGLRVMGDLTTNHTGDGHDWFAASRDVASPEAGYYLWNESRDDWVGWTGHRHLPKLDWRDEALAARMVEDETAAVRRWLAPPYALDGWRIDVANMTGRHGPVDVNAAVAARVRRVVAADNPDAAVVAEHFHDATEDLRRGAWDAGMNYAGFLRPVWQWLAQPGTGIRYLEAPVPVPSRTGAEAAATMRDVLAGIPWRVAARAWNLLSTHDTARIRTLTGSPERHRAAAALLYTYVGAPFVFAGDEGGASGVNGEHSRTPMPWTEIEDGGPRWDAGTHATYRALGRLRSDRCALRHGGLRWVAATDDALVYLRECGHEAVLVAVAREATSLTVDLPGRPLEHLYGEVDASQGDGITLTARGAAAGVWRLGRA
ncbi:alpha-amylase family glycosyl hydrolase [Demequina gelatinilytica]|uniref:alpha-amylase family glycosyl hydrolase n=1 Tax=Demequina gelatinilytica TaxID=1638980 RepID=UPI000B2138BB|nr:alpha-amylase family glycosyl hydrolase [Demequina gelatinilytica]